MKPQVIIIGRPNVGKSTLFNRLVGKKLALVDDQPGVTRDRRMGDAEIAGMKFTIVDTAGWEDEDDLTLPGRMRKQTEASLEGADAALFVVDARAGLTPLDNEIARYTEEVALGIVGVGDKATIKDRRGAGDLCKCGGDEAAGAALCCCESQGFLTSGGQGHAGKVFELIGEHG